MSDFDIEWIDRGREPTCEPDPAYPDGIDIDAAQGTWPYCLVQLPYPAKRCGYYALKCRTCAMSLIITTAGRADDPRSVKVPCLLAGGGKTQ